MQYLIYLLILCAKVVEISIGVTRIVLITRGERLLGAILGFFEVLIWVMLVSTVLRDIINDPVKVVIYALGFAIGNYVGSMVEQKLGIGNVRIEAIVKEVHGQDLVKKIRAHGYAVTVIEGEGMNHSRNVLVMNIPRKNYMEVVNMIKNMQYNVVITVTDIKPVFGGYGMLRR
ncbi:MAG: DUF5698 domain-containing protein [Eubacteriales bacterium]